MGRGSATLIYTTVVVVATTGGAAAQEAVECTRSEDGGATGVVRGLVRDVETSVPLRGASVVLTWRESSDRRSRTLEVDTDATGAFAFCDARLGATLMVHARYAGESSRAEAVQIGQTGEATIDITVDAPHGRIAGQVLDHRTGRPITAAAITLRGTPLERSSTDEGSFSLDAVPPGTYDVAVSHIGYRTVSDSVKLELGANVEVTVRLAPDAVPHAAIEVVVRSHALERSGFYERMDRAQGQFVTRSDPAAQTAVRASDLLRGIAGVQLAPRTDGAGYVPTGRGGCAFRYMLNGNRVGAGFEIDDIAPEWIEALEIYPGPSTIPIEFSALPTEYRSDCGVVVIWTRSGP